MVAVPDFGKDKWNVVRNLSKCFLGTRTIGETLKALKGGVGKGPTVRHFETSSVKFPVTTSGFKYAVGKLCGKRGHLGPE